MAKTTSDIAVSVLYWIQYKTIKTRTCHVSQKLLVRCLHS